MQSLQFVKWGIVLVAVLFAWSPSAMAGQDEQLVVNPLAMGAVDDRSTSNQDRPQVEKPTLMIRLGGTHFDPLYKIPTRSSVLPSIRAYTNAETGYYIVQFDGPVKAQWKAELQNAGVEIFDYVPEFAFTVRMSPDREDAVRGLPHVRWVGILQPAFRISNKAMSLMYAKSGAPETTTALRVNVFPGVNLDELQDRIQSLGGTVEEQRTTARKSTLKVVIPTENIAILSAIDGVKWIEPMPKWKMYNDVSTDIMNVRAARNTHGLYGSGQVVGVADTGLDRGSALPASLHDDFEDGAGGSRVLAVLDTAGDGNPSDTDGHGTHVAGSVLGNGLNSGSDPTTNDFPITSLAGTAPKAGMVFQALRVDSSNPDVDGRFGLPADLGTLFGDSRSAGADLHTNSWGAALYGQYTASSADVDDYMWDNKDFLILFAAGNEGVDMDADGVVDQYSLSSPGTAKNCLTVGASEGDRPGGVGYDFNWGDLNAWPNDYPANPVAGDHVSDDDRGMAAFSSRGPTLDGRIKPDIVAPGTNILSVRSAYGGIGWGEYSSNYVWMGGTSMATPLVAGSAALMREYLMNTQGFNPPSAALIKAALLNCAEDISPGQYGAPAAEIPISPVPNSVAGWGRLNLGDGINPAAPSDIIYFDEPVGMGTGVYTEYRIAVSDASAPLKVNLVWTDYPAAPAAQGGLVNDLDLQVTDPGAVVHYADNASQASTLETLMYDTDFTIEDLYLVSEVPGYATRFTPNSYPANVESVRINAQNLARGSGFSVVIYDDAGGEPGSILFSKSVPYFPTFAFVTIPVEGVQIASGNFYVGIQVASPSNQMIYADGTDTGGRSFYYANNAWITTEEYAWYIRANVSTTSASTSFDRVNNTLGVTIDTPTVGSYTIRVAGYNVPSGPQPFALVASGNVQNQTNPAGTIQFSAANYTVAENAGTANITLARLGGHDGAVSVDYATGSSGTATSGSDFAPTSGTLSFADGVSSQSFSVTIINDSADETDETITLSLSDPSGGADLGSFATAAITITGSVGSGNGGGGGGGGGGCMIATAVSE